MIRHAVEADIPQIIELSQELYAYNHEIAPEAYPDCPSEFNQWEIKNCFENSVIFVSEYDGKIVAYAVADNDELKVSDDISFNQLYLKYLVVTESARRKGEGAALVHAVKDYAAEHKCSCIKLYVTEGNVSAVDFYKALGFNPQRTEMRFDLENLQDIL